MRIPTDSRGSKWDKRARAWPRARTATIALLALALTSLFAAVSGPAEAESSARGKSTHSPNVASSTVWLCRPGLSNDPCTSSLKTTNLTASGKSSVVDPTIATNSRFDCFYVYPTVSRELTANADLRVQASEIDTAIAQASPFSSVGRVFAPMYRQVTLATLAAYPKLDVPAGIGETAENSAITGFQDYLAHYNDGRPIVFLGHSQGAAVLITMLARLVDNDATLRNRLVLAIILGGDVEVRTGSLVGGSFAHIPACSRAGESGCVIAYSSFPSTPPAASLFGRVGQGVALQSGQTQTNNRQVVCVNPAAVGGGSAELDPYFPSEGAVSTPWVAFPGLYRAHCETADGATWLSVQKATGPTDTRPVVTETDGPDWGYHGEDVNLALGNLLADVKAAESSWSTAHAAK